MLYSFARGYVSLSRTVSLKSHKLSERRPRRRSFFRVALMNGGGGLSARDAQPRGEDDNVEEGRLGKDFETAQCLLNAEVALILGKKKEEVEGAGRDVSLNRVFLESLKYAKRFNAYNDDTLVQVREALLKYNVSEYEVGAIGNLKPDNAEEGRALVPSLNKREDLDDDQLEALLDELNRYSVQSQAF